MRILLTNDDGITAPGIAALYEAASHLGEVFVVAPSTVQSAMSHGVTLHRPILTHTQAGHSPKGNPLFEGIAVDGRPADCVKLAISNLIPGPVDLVLSGINSGANIGINVIYSGTVAAAMEAGFMGIPAVAMSLHIGHPQKTDWSRATEISRRVIEQIIEHQLEKHTVLNVNIPVLDDGAEPIGTRVVPASTSPIVDEYHHELRMGGDRMFTAVPDLKFHHTPADSDVDAIYKKYITITPLRFDLTRHDHLDTWSERLTGGRNDQGAG
ncbi:MAG: 5'/3'-nucleotidase SurE [Phycisphaeraceae bacterium]|nr:5'/3'-nucleotidase SurE [Phycisphaeraceae bacterium]